jgi:hypothetical protein
MNAIVMTIAMCYALEEVKAVILRQQGRSALREVERAALARRLNERLRAFQRDPPSSAP